MFLLAKPFYLKINIFFIHVYKRSRQVVKTRWPTIRNDIQKTGPFHFWTQINHSNTGIVRISNVHCICILPEKHPTPRRSKSRAECLNNGQLGDPESNGILPFETQAKVSGIRKSVSVS
jgi:hypothetical protein